MKRFYFIFLPVVLVFLYSIPGVFCLSGGGGDSFLFILLYWYSYIVYPEYFVCRGGGIASSSLKKKLVGGGRIASSSLKKKLCIGIPI